MTDTYYDLGDYHRKITTTSPDAQIWFDRGLQWTYCFNPGEAVNCFKKATEYDPDCAMAYWGIAFASGPNYNKAWRLFDKADLEIKIPFIQRVMEKAKENAVKNATSFETDLINALASRFPKTMTTNEDDFKKLNLAYAESMRPFYQKYSDDLDAAALFADSLMCLSPRQLWDIDTGEAIGSGTLEARKVLEDALSRSGSNRHPVLNHLYIHLMEMSPYPEVALTAADNLRSLSPDGSHLAHMSTHIDNACGDWRRVVYSNLDAARADDKYFAKEMNPDAWYVAYRAHNLIVGAYGAMMAGKSREALDMAHRINKILTPEVLSISSPPMANLCESYCTTLPHVMIRFGLWEEILELELPEDKELYSSTVAMISYARGIAFSALRRIPEAEQAHIEFEAAAAAVPEERYNSIPVKEIYALNIATKMIHGELEYRKGNIEKAFMILREGIELEDALPYSDPPAWLQPVRHAYCALNMEQGNYEVAATEYRIELGLDKKLGRRRIRPNNVWSLHGLYECLTKLGRDKEAEEISLQRDIAVASADIPIEASCFCRLSAFEKDACCSNS